MTQLYFNDHDMIYIIINFFLFNEKVIRHNIQISSYFIKGLMVSHNARCNIQYIPTFRCETSYFEQNRLITKHTVFIHVLSFSKVTESIKCYKLKSK